jgi:hypothetical protein
MTATTRCSLWALPAEPDRALLGAVIERLSRSVGVRPFAPHLTLVGAVPDPESAAGAIAAVATRAAPIPVMLAEVADSDEHFRCITLVARSDPPIMDLRSKCAAALGVTPGEFRPHLSLLYADCDPFDRACQRRRIGLDMPHSTVIDAVSLVRTGGHDPRSWSTEAVWELCGEPDRS